MGGSSTGIIDDGGSFAHLHFHSPLLWSTCRHCHCPALCHCYNYYPLWTFYLAAKHDVSFCDPLHVRIVLGRRRSAYVLFCSCPGYRGSDMLSHSYFLLALPRLCYFLCSPY